MDYNGISYLIKMRNKTYKQYSNKKEARKEKLKKEEITLYVGFVKKKVLFVAFVTNKSSYKTLQMLPGLYLTLKRIGDVGGGAGTNLIQP